MSFLQSTFSVTELLTSFVIYRCDSGLWQLANFIKNPALEGIVPVKLPSPKMPARRIFFFAYEKLGIAQNIMKYVIGKGAHLASTTSLHDPALYAYTIHS